jgi:hypothetical protein
MIYKYGIGGDDGRREKNSHQRPCVEMMLAERIGKPEVIDTSHLKAIHLERAYLHTKTNDGHNDGRQKI